MDQFEVSKFVTTFIGEEPLESDSTQVEQNYENDITSGKILKDESLKYLAKLLCLTLQNAINSSSLMKHNRSIKTSLPFLYNQTIRKIDRIGSTHKSDIYLKYSTFLWTVQWLEDPINTRHLTQTFFDTLLMLAMKYEFILVPLIEQQKDVIEIDPHNSRLLCLYHFLNDHLSSHQVGADDSKYPSNNAKADFIILRLLLHSSLSFVLEPDEFAHSVECSAELVIDACINLFQLWPHEAQQLSTTSDQRHYHAGLTAVQLKLVLLTRALQLQAVNSILRSMSFCNPNQANTSASPMKRSGQSPTLLSRMNLNSNTQAWFLQLAERLAPLQRTLALATQAATLLISLSCRHEVALAMLSTGGGLLPAGIASPVGRYANGIDELEGTNYFPVNRTEAIQVLSQLPMGSFIIRPHDSKAELYFLSFQGTAAEGVKHAIIRREIMAVSADELDNNTLCLLTGTGIDERDESPNVKRSLQLMDTDPTSPCEQRTIVVYKCGKVGPCRSICELLQSIGKVLPSGLIFEPITEESLKRLGVTLPKAETEQCRDLVHRLGLHWNHDMWIRVLAAPAGPLNTPMHAIDDRSSQSRIPSIRTDGSATSVNLGERDMRLKDLLETLIVSLAFKGMVKQLQDNLAQDIPSSSISLLNSDQLIHVAVRAVSDMCSKRFRLPRSEVEEATGKPFRTKSPALDSDDSHFAPGRSADAVLGVKRNMSGKFAVQSTSTVSISSSAPEVYVYESLIDSLQIFSTRSETGLLDQIANLSLAENVQNDTPLSPLPNNIVFAETLVTQLLRTCDAKHVRLPGKGCTNFTDHRCLCMESTTLMGLLSRVVQEYNTYGFVRENRITAMKTRNESDANISSLDSLRRIFSENFEEKTPKHHSHHTTSNSFSKTNQSNNSSSSSVAGTIGNPQTPHHTPKDVDTKELQKLALLLVQCTPLVKRLFYRRNSDVSVDGGNNQSSVSNVEVALQLLSPAEYVTWLMEEGVLQTVTKLADTAFHGTRLYYKYKDAWEVHVAEADLLGEEGQSKKFGRERYGHIFPNCGLKGLTTVLRSFSMSGVSLTATTGHGKHDMSAESSSTTKLWELLKAESWLVTAVGESSVRGDEGEEDRKDLVKQAMPRSNSDSIWRNSIGGDVETFLSCVSRHVYRNSLFKNLRLPHRFTASLQVDLFGLKEIGTKDGFTFVNLTSGLELYAILRLDRLKNATQTLAKVNVVRAPMDGSAVTKPIRAELIQSPDGKAGSQYNWRERVKFRFGLPEELHSEGIAVDLTQISLENVANIELLDPPQMLSVSVYEKAFFADSKLGEVNLPLNALSINRPIRDWVSLTGGSTSSNNWSVHVQLRLRFPVRALEYRIHGSSSSSSNSSTGLSTGAAKQSVVTATAEAFAAATSLFRTESRSSLSNGQPKNTMIRHMEDIF